MEVVFFEEAVLKRTLVCCKAQSLVPFRKPITSEKDAFPVVMIGLVLSMLVQWFCIAVFASFLPKPSAMDLRFPWGVCLVKLSDKAVIMVTKIFGQFRMTIWNDHNTVNCGIICILGGVSQYVGDSNVRADDAANAILKEMT
ncbi:hypothetical protein C5167_021687 [Papaver somniferum]|uniref:Uncharacterized protein n=1 Tax=Papaver somniferum TaxID=3469 RepID=A0A4Y7JJK0_PAPSO|nr:hypothetical protein C5167_021687 [Papaver somniferum]